MKRVLKSVPAAVLLLALYVMIFGFSSQSGEESGSLSQLVSEKCVEFINVLTGRDWSETKVDSLAEYFEHPVRKLAHFTEYAGMGVLVWWLLNGWIRKKKNLYFLVVGWVFVSAAADEFHQYFVPGRYASFWDVLLDTCGGAFGLLLCIGISAYLSNKNKNRTAVF